MKQNKVKRSETEMMRHMIWKGLPTLTLLTAADIDRNRVSCACRCLYDNLLAGELTNMTQRFEMTFR